MGSNPLDPLAQLASDDHGNDSASAPHPSDSLPLRDSATSPDTADLWRYIEHLERWRQAIGFEIHDGLTQQITAALMFLESADSDSPDPTALERCRSILQEALAESRRLIQGLSPQRLDEEGLEAALKEFLAHETTYSQAEVRLQISSEFPPLATWQRSNLFRFLQESITNAQKHSGASLIEVSVQVQAGHVVAQVRDNGAGFDPQKVKSTGYGLKGLQARADLLEGELAIESQANRGTTLTLRFRPSAPLR